MQDSNLKYYILVEGAKEGAASFKLVGDAAKQAANAVNDNANAATNGSNSIRKLNDATNANANATNKAAKSHEGYFTHIAKTTIQSALINKLFLELVDVSSQAVKQVDLMNNFPATIASMGQSAEDASSSLNKLRDYVGAIGGDLGTATSMVTRFAGATGSVKSATAIFAGVNNALIAGDSSIDEQRLALMQFAQALERGKPDMREWMALTQNMSFQLGMVAKSMGYVNANALGEALRDGEESMAAFSTALTQLSTGTGPIAQQAQMRMQGVQYTFNVMKNALVQGLATIMNAFGRSIIVGAMNLITGAVITLVGWVVTAINAFKSLYNTISGFFGGPQLKETSLETAAIANNAGAIADSLDDGAGSAKDVGKGLKGAGKEAKKLAGQLASFDKMNVLQDKSSADSGGSGGSGGGAGGGGVGGGGFDPGAIGSLDGAFGDIGGKLKEASLWAKILAGALAALAANSLIKKIFGVSPLKLFVKGIKALPGVLKDAYKNMRFTMFGIRALFEMSPAGEFVKKIGTAFKGLPGTVGRAIVGLGPILIGAFISIFGTIGSYVAIAVLGVATAATIPLWGLVAIGAVVVAAIVAVIWLIWTNWETIWGWIKTAFSTFWDWITGLWNTLYSIFEGPIKWLLAFWKGIFIAIVAIVAIFLELIFKLVVGTITLVFNILKTIGKWIFDNVITPVLNFFIGLWNAIVDAVKAAWDWIFDKILKPVGTWIFKNVITPVLDIFKKLWDKVSGFVSDFFTGLKVILGGIWGWIKRNVVDKIASLFSGMWDGIKNGLSSMLDGLKTIFKGAASIFKMPLNGIIELLNKAIRGVNKLKVPDWVPGLGGKTPGIPEIPKLARGGVVAQATYAMIGEDGAEAVVPLEKNTEWIDMLASKINSATGGNGQPVQLVVQIGEERIASKVIDLINEKTQMSGRNVIYV